MRKTIFALLFVACICQGQISLHSKKIYASRFGDKTSATINTVLSGFSTQPVHIVLNAGQWSITNNVTFPTNSILEFETGSSISLGVGTTFTINGELVAGDQRIFYGSGTLAGSPRMLYRYANWGATGTYDIGVGYLPDSTSSGLDDVLTVQPNAGGLNATNINTVQGTNGNFENITVDTLTATTINAGTISATNGLNINGAVTNGDLTVDGSLLVTSNDMAISYLGFPKLQLSTNMVTITSSGSTPISLLGMTNCFDNDMSTHSYTGNINGSHAHLYGFDLTNAYEGYLIVKAYLYNYDSVLTYSSGSSIWDGTKTGAVINFGTVDSVTSDNANSTNVVRVTTPISGRYVWVYVGGAISASPDYYYLYDISIYGTTNAYRNLGGF